MGTFFKKLKLSNEAVGDKVLKTDANGVLVEANYTGEQLQATSVINNEGEGKNFLADDGTYKKGVEIVNDLTTGGVDKALSAEAGKDIKVELDNIQGQVNTANQIADNILGN